MDNPRRRIAGFSKNGRKLLDLFLNCVFHKKVLIICINILFNLSMHSNFFATFFAAKIFVKQLLWNNMCMAELFCHSPNFLVDLSFARGLATLAMGPPPSPTVVPLQS
jgi:hypothetical protein